MALHVDHLLDRIQLKSRIRFWRILAILALLLAALVALRGHGGKGTGLNAIQDHIARVKINGVIMDDKNRDEMMKDLVDDKRTKAIIVTIDSPGGSAAASQDIYLQLRKIAANKPVVCVMRGMAASGGFMTSLGCDYTVAREGTLTGSIGVILELAEVTELAKKLGIEPIVVKSGYYKGAPSPTEKFTPEQRASVQRVIDDFHRYFKTITAERRHLPLEAVTQLAQGQIYSGNQAVDLKLVDKVGGEEEVLAWLQTEKKLSKDLPVVDVEPVKEDEGIFSKVSSLVSGKGLASLMFKPQGLMVVWP